MIRLRPILSIALCFAVPMAVFSADVEDTGMEISVSGIIDNRNIPVKYTCDGENVSPEISWSGLPRETKSLAVTIIDPDAPMGDFRHWLIYDIPVQAQNIPGSGPLPAGAKEMNNDFGRTSYGGPCPPSGVHRYAFTVYALNVENLADVDEANFLRLLENHKIASAQIVGLYSRQR
ncbi:MAG: YbhB/YbcL family Raf kinase inhibitor-like protein [Candidatus Omnitrophota bacterium]